MHDSSGNNRTGVEESFGGWNVVAVGVRKTLLAALLMMAAAVAQAGAQVPLPAFALSSFISSIIFIASL